MALLTREFLTSIGVELDEQNYQLLAEHFETTLHERVIDEIVAELSQEQAEELARLYGAGDERVYPWLIENVPQLSEIVADEVDILLGEIAENNESL